MLLQLFPEVSLVALAAAHVHTRDPVYSRLVAGGVLVIFAGVLLKKVSKRLDGIVPRSVIYRPPDAFACNSAQREACGNEMGMPSIHSMVAGYYAARLWPRHPGASAALLMVPLSRLSSRDFPIVNHGDHGCHTWLQVCIGFSIGVLIGTRLS